MGVDRIAAFARIASWRGRSGRSYALTPESLADFALTGDAIHLLARGTFVLWVGDARDVITDPNSRARFRLALATADRAYRLESRIADDVERMTMVWDLEGGEPQAGLSAA